MVPKHASSRRLSELSANDLYALNSLPKVKIDREEHGDYGLNDIVLEMSHLLDRNTVRKVELSLLEDNLRK